MTYAADLHIHSPFARSTSKQITFENLARWARLKGIDLLATGDFTHPVWFQEMADQLRDSGNGLYELGGVHFVLGTEVSCSSLQGGRRRRVHLLVLAPSLSVVERISASLASKGKLESDGRPALRISPRNLVYELLEIDPRCMVIPAHAWTPWFGVFGSRSGFDSLEECFGDAAAHVPAVETGLSSDPAMNWRVPELDSRSIVSFSDAHSLPKLGREMTVFRGEPGYVNLALALRTQDIAYTVEFFPEEGKYHFSGHRKCGVSYSSDQVRAHGALCPVCNKQLTLGVMQRVEDLAARHVETSVDERGFTTAGNGRPPYKTLVALDQIIAESLGVGVNTKRVRAEYMKLVDRLGSELSVLMDASLADIEAVSGDRVAEGISKVRAGDISIEPGYDGLYGKVSVWPD